MELSRQIQWSMRFMLLHWHVLFRTFRMDLQSLESRTGRHSLSLNIIIQQDHIVNLFASRSLHVLLSWIAVLKKIMQNLINFAFSSTRNLTSHTKQIMSSQEKAIKINNNQTVLTVHFKSQKFQQFYSKSKKKEKPGHWSSINSHELIEKGLSKLDHFCQHLHIEHSKSSLFFK